MSHRSAKVLEFIEESCPYPRPTTDFSSWEKLTLTDGGNLMRVLRVLARKFSWASLTGSALEAELYDIQNEVEFYRNTKFTLRPSTFFRRPKEIPKVCLSEPFLLSEGEVLDLMFQSNFRPHYRPFIDEFAEYKENRTVHARLWRHPPGKSLGRIVAIHGWFMGDQRMNALTLVPGYFFRLGLDVLLYELPYHGRRAPTNPGKSPLFPSAHVARTNEGFAQAIYELRALAAWLNSEEQKPLGAIGMSLGGYTASLWASLDKLDFVIPVVPLVSIGELVWGLIKEFNQPDASFGKGDLRGLSLEELRAIYAVHCPLSYQPKVPISRRMILAGLGDPVIPLSQPQMLWEHWGKPKIHWLSGGHFSQFAEVDALREVHDFLHLHKLAHRELLTIS